MSARIPLMTKAEAFQLYLDRLELSETARFNYLIQQLDGNVQRMLANAGEIANLSNAELNQLLRALANVNKEAVDRSTNELLTRLESFSAYSYAVEASTLATINRKVANTLVHAATKRLIWQEALGRPLGATGDLLEPFIRNLGTRQISMIDKVIRQGHVNGMTTAQMTRILRGTKSKGYADGVMNKLGKQSATVVRTSMQHINNSARQSLYAENADIVEGYQWVATLDSRTSKICQDRDGQVYKIGDGPIPPGHPNCRSTTIPKLNKAFDIFDEGATRSSADGYVPADTTFHEWMDGYDMAASERASGITRPKPGSQTGQVWDIADRLSIGGKPATRAAVIEEAKRLGINPATASTQFQRWRTSQVGGGTGTPPAPPPAPPPLPPRIPPPVIPRPVPPPAVVSAPRPLPPRDAPGDAPTALHNYATGALPKAVKEKDRVAAMLSDDAVRGMSLDELNNYQMSHFARIKLPTSVMKKMRTDPVFEAQWRAVFVQFNQLRRDYKIPRIRQLMEVPAEHNNANGLYWFNGRNLALKVMRDNTRHLRPPPYLSRDELAAFPELLRNYELQKLGTYSWTVGNRIEHTLIHEFGHHADNANMWTTSTWNSVTQQRSYGGLGQRAFDTPYRHLVSKYGSTNPHELVAESFSLWVNNDPSQYWRIHPELLKAFEKLRRKK